MANAVGGALIAIVVGRTDTSRLLAAAPLLSCAALITLATRPGVGLTIGLLAAVGASYGAIIALYPFAVLQLSGSDAYPTVYGRVFTAWGVAGLTGPFLAGLLFDSTGSYRAALTIAAFAALGSALASTKITQWSSS